MNPQFPPNGPTEHSPVANGPSAHSHMVHDAAANGPTVSDATMQGTTAQGTTAQGPAAYSPTTPGRSNPPHIPAGARVVVRTAIGVDPADGRMKFRDFVGHVRAWDGITLELTRDAAANGSRPAEDVSIDAQTIVRLKPVPERPNLRSEQTGASA